MLGSSAVSSAVSLTELLFTLQLEEAPLLPGEIPLCARRKRLICTISRVDQELSGNYDHELIVAYPPRDLAAFFPHTTTPSHADKLFSRAYPSRQSFACVAGGLQDVFNLQSFLRKVGKIELPLAGTKRPSDCYIAGHADLAGRRPSAQQKGLPGQASDKRSKHNSETNSGGGARDAKPIPASATKKARIENHDECFPDLFWAHDHSTYADCIWDCSFDHKNMKKFDDFRRRSLEWHWRWGNFRREGLDADKYWRAMHAKPARTVQEPERSRQKWLLTRQILFGTSLNVAIPTCPGRALRHTRRRDLFELPSRDGSHEGASNAPEITRAIDASAPQNALVMTAPEVAAVSLAAPPVMAHGSASIQQRQLVQINEMHNEFRQTHRALWEAFNSHWNTAFVASFNTIIRNAYSQARAFGEELDVLALENALLQPFEFGPFNTIQVQNTGPVENREIEDASSLQDETVGSPSTPQSDEAPATDPTTPGSAMIGKGTSSNFGASIGGAANLNDWQYQQPPTM